MPRAAAGHATPEYFDEFTESELEAMPPELRDYLEANLNGPSTFIGYTTALRRGQLFTEGAPAAKRFSQYYFSECLERLESVKRRFHDSDEERRADRLLFLGLYPRIGDTRALPMADAARHLPELRDFKDRYLKIRMRHMLKIAAADAVAEDFEGSGMAHNAAMNRKLAQYKDAFLSTYHQLRTLLLPLIREYSPMLARQFEQAA